MIGDRTYCPTEKEGTGPVTPAAVSILLPAYEVAMEAAFADFGVPIKTIRQRSFGGEVYTQDVDLDGKHHPEAPPPWWLLGLLVRVIPSLRRTMRAELVSDTVGT